MFLHVNKEQKEETNPVVMEGKMEEPKLKESAENTTVTKKKGPPATTSVIERASLTAGDLNDPSTTFFRRQSTIRRGPATSK